MMSRRYQFHIKTNKQYFPEIYSIYSVNGARPTRKYRRFHGFKIQQPLVPTLLRRLSTIGYPITEAIYMYLHKICTARGCFRCYPTTYFHMSKRKGFYYSFQMTIVNDLPSLIIVKEIIILCEKNTPMSLISRVLGFWIIPSFFLN